MYLLSSIDIKNIKCEEMIMSLYLNIPYSDKDEAKNLGARWDPDRKSWYVFSRKDYYKFSKWIFKEDETQKLLLINQLYIIKGIHTCFKCKKPTTVIGFGIDDILFLDKNTQRYSIEHGDIHICSSPVIMNSKILEQLKNKYNYYESYSKTTKSSYYANHCKNCDSIQGNFYLYDEVDSPFFVCDKATAGELTIHTIKCKDDYFIDDNCDITYDGYDGLIKEYAKFV